MTVPPAIVTGASRGIEYGIARGAYGTLATLVLASGVGSTVSLAEYPMRRVDEQVAVGLCALFALVAATSCTLGRRLRAARTWGRVISQILLEGVHPEPGLDANGSIKVALMSLGRSINAEEAIHGGTASTISPGYVDSDMSASDSQAIATDTMISVEAKIGNLVLTKSRGCPAAHSHQPFGCRRLPTLTSPTSTHSERSNRCPRCSMRCRSRL